MDALRPLSRRVVITGLGAVSCCGIGKDAFWAAVRDGKSGIRRIENFEVSHLPCQVAGQIVDFDPLDYLPSRKASKQGRFTHLGFAAVRWALDDAQLAIGEVPPEQVGVAFGTSNAGAGNLTDVTYRLAVESGIRAVHPGAVNEIPVHATAAHIACEMGLKGPSLSSSTGCATGILTIAQAFEAVRNGQVQCMIAGASEACISPFTFDLLCRQKVLSTHNHEPERACRPFDKHRSGLVVSEGAGAVVLESAEHALRRGAHIYAEVLGYGTACEGYHLVAPDPQGGQVLARAITAALRMARVAPESIDYACAHGIGTREYDIVDTEGLKLALGEHARRIPVSSIKGVTGQPFGAAGTLQAVAACMVFETSTVPPTINYTTPDPRCDLDYVPNVARRARVNKVVLNSHSYGGTHAALILGRFCQ